MNIFKRLLHLTLVMAFLAVLGVSGAFAATSNPINVNDLAFLSGNSQAYTGGFSSSFLWDVQGLGYDTSSGHGGEYADFYADDQKMYSSYIFSPGLPPGPSPGVLFENVDLTTAYFQPGWFGDEYDLDSNHVQTYEITAAFTYQGFDFQVGDVILAFEISGGNTNTFYNYDYDDLVVLARPTPIPGAVWLMGSGLLGLVGVRRKLMKRG